MILLTGAGGVGYWFYLDFTQKERVIAEQARVIGVLEDRLDRAWATELVGDLRIDFVRESPENHKPEIGATFVQYGQDTETPAFERTFTVPGNEIYIDTLVVKFERELVDAGDGLRGKSMMLFRRAFGDDQKPTDGVPLYRSGDGPRIPTVFQVDEQPTAFEQRIWREFWQLANDPDLAKSEGVAVAQGEAPHIKPVAGQVYKLTLRAAGGLDITPRLPRSMVGERESPKPATAVAP